MTLPMTFMTISVDTCPQIYTFDVAYENLVEEAPPEVLGNGQGSPGGNTCNAIKPMHVGHVGQAVRVFTVPISAPVGPMLIRQHQVGNPYNVASYRSTNICLLVGSEPLVSFNARFVRLRPK